MRILYLHQHYHFENESGSTRSHHIATELGKRGHEVVLICAGKKERMQDMKYYQVHRLAIDYSNAMSFYQRSLAFQKYNMSVYKLVKKMDGFHLCLASSTPLNVGFLALRLKKKLGIPYIFEVRDLWPQAPVELGYIRQKWFQRWLYKMEAKIYNAAERVVALSQPQQENILHRFPEKMVELVTNFSNESNIVSPIEFENNRRQRWNERTFRLIYFGALGKANDLAQLKGLSEEIQNKGLPIEIHIYGEGSEKEMLQKTFADASLKNISFYSSVAKSEIPKLLVDYDFSYISFAQYDILRTNSPNKFFDSMAAGLYCLTNIQSWFGDLAESNAFGMYAIPGSESATIEMLNKICKNPRLLVDACRNSTQLCKEKYSSALQPVAMADIIEKQLSLNK